jgi:hypothetical protein
MPRKNMNVQILPRDDVIEALSEQMQKTPKLLETALKRNARRFKSQLLQKLSVEPGKPDYPLRWASEKQRRAFFATDGFGRGIGADRTHELSQGWRADIKGNAFFSLDIYNTQDYARFVVGDDKQPFHIDTGWMDAANILMDERERYEDTVIDTFFTIADPTAGVL